VPRVRNCDAVVDDRQAWQGLPQGGVPELTEARPTLA
jgi:hypothetical protein